MWRSEHWKTEKQKLKMILNIDINDRITNKDVLNQVQTDLHFLIDLKEENLSTAGMWWDSSGF